MKQSKQNLSNINSYLISRLKSKHQFKYIDIFHFRNLPKIVADIENLKKQ